MSFTPLLGFLALADALVCINLANLQSLASKALLNEGGYACQARDR